MSLVDYGQVDLKILFESPRLIMREYFVLEVEVEPIDHFLRVGLGQCGNISQLVKRQVPLVRRSIRTAAVE